MPKQTFFNLAEDKREHITRVAIKAFAELGYRETSITYIVAEAGIAKGSFYQYFEDKDDLYLYIMSLIAQRKLGVYERELPSLEHISLTEFMRRVFHIQLAEFQDAPELMKVGLDFARNLHEPVGRKFMESMQGTSDTLYLDYIAAEKRRGQLDPNVDGQILNFMLVSLANYMTAWLETHGESDMTGVFVDEVVDKLEYILTNGIYTGAKWEKETYPPSAPQSEAVS